MCTPYLSQCVNESCKAVELAVDGGWLSLVGIRQPITFGKVAVWCVRGRLLEEGGLIVVGVWMMTVAVVVARGEPWCVRGRLLEEGGLIVVGVWIMTVAVVVARGEPRPTPSNISPWSGIPLLAVVSPSVSSGTSSIASTLAKIETRFHELRPVVWIQ
jgi:hypothetical protein